MELFPLSRSMPNFQPHRAASDLGTLLFVPKCHFPLPAAMGFLFTLAPSGTCLAFTHHILVPAFTGAFFPGAGVRCFKNVATKF